ncbi:hypothetical protein GVAV_000613 [Gurleya vavrai]
MSNFWHSKHTKRVFIFIMIFSFLCMYFIALTISHKLDDKKPTIKSKNGPISKETMHVFPAKLKETEANFFKNIRKIAISPIPDIKTAERILYCDDYYYFDDLKIIFDDLKLIYNKQKQKLIYLKNVKSISDPPTDIKVYDQSKIFAELEAELLFTSDYIKMLYELSNEEILHLIAFRINYLKQNVLSKLNTFSDAKSFFTNFEKPIIESLHILAVFSFKYKSTIKTILNNFTFGNYNGFFDLLNSLNYNNKINKEIFEMVSKLNFSQIEVFLENLGNAITRYRQSNVIKRILNDTFEMVFYPKNVSFFSSYFFCENDYKDIDITKNMYEILLNVTYEDKNSIFEKKMNFEENTEKDNDYENYCLWRKKNFFTSKILYFLNFFKYKFCNAKIILYCFIKLKIKCMSSKENKTRINPEIFDDCIYFDENFNKKLFELDEIRIIFNALTKLYDFVLTCSEMDIFEEATVSNIIKKYIEFLKNDNQNLIDITNEFLKIVAKNENYGRKLFKRINYRKK